MGQDKDTHEWTTRTKQATGADASGCPQAVLITDLLTVDPSEEFLFLKKLRFKFPQMLFCRFV